MLPVTCVLTCESAAARHEIQIWNTAALNCMTSPMWFNKTQAATLRSRVRPPVSTRWTSLDLFCDLQPLPQPPRGCQEARQRCRRGGGETGVLHPFTHLAVAPKDGGVHVSSCGDLMGSRKWLMRSGISFGDAGLPSSVGRWSRPIPPPPHQATSSKSFTICALWPSPLAPA